MTRTISRRAAFRAIQRDMRRFSSDVLRMPLYRYQSDWANHALRVASSHTAATIAVEMSRQSGKNETSAHLETALMAIHARQGGEIVKTAPTWKPQIVNSKRRFEKRAADAKARLPFLDFRGTQGYIVECGAAAIQFLSAQPQADVVGATASLLLEVDEAQDVDPAKFDKDFAPMRASTGAPVIFYGTTWTDDTLLARAIREAQADPAGGYYRVPWDRVAEENPAYGHYVEGEIARLGQEHPLILTQYFLKPLPGLGRMFSEQQLRLMVGQHSRQPARKSERQIVAGLDFAGADETAGDWEALASGSARDSIALSIGAVEWITVADGIIEPFVRCLDRYEWTNVRPEDTHTALVDILRNRWRVDRVHADETGIGETSVRFLQKALGAATVRGLKFDGGWSTHSRLAFQFIAAANGARFQDYAPAGFDPLDVANRAVPDPGDVSKYVWWQRGHARLEAKPGRKVRAYVPDNEGHDDLLIADLLMLDAAHNAGQPKRAAGSYQG